MNIKEQDLVKFTKIIFKHAYSLGAFSGDLNKKDRGYELMLSGCIDKDICEDGIKELLEVLYK